MLHWTAVSELLSSFSTVVSVAGSYVGLDGFHW
jgi:hypothetical protein